MCLWPPSGVVFTCHLPLGHSCPVPYLCMDLTDLSQLANPSQRRWKIPQIELTPPHPPHPTSPLGFSQDLSWVTLLNLLPASAVVSIGPVLCFCCMCSNSWIALTWKSGLSLHTASSPLPTLKQFSSLSCTESPFQENLGDYSEHCRWLLFLGPSFEIPPSRKPTLNYHCGWQDNAHSQALAEWLLASWTCSSLQANFSYATSTFQTSVLYTVSKWSPGSSEHERNSKGPSRRPLRNSKGT